MNKSSGGKSSAGETSKSFNGAAKPVSTKSTTSGSAAPKPKVMTPAPGGMGGGPTPPIGAKVNADRKVFAQQMAHAKAQAAAQRTAAKPVKPVTPKQAFAKAAVKPASPAFAKAAKTAAPSKPSVRPAFKAASAPPQPSKSKGRGGR